MNQQNTDITQEAAIEAARQAAQKVVGPLTQREFRRLTGISKYTIGKVFAGGWQEFIRKAQVEANPRARRHYADDELLAEYHRVASEMGSFPRWASLTARSKISVAAFWRRFGGMPALLSRYREWMERVAPDSKLLPILQQRVQRTEGVITPRGKPVTYGEPLDFRAIRHAPINEKGVIYLFGVVAADLGFLVEAVHQSFPDCEAKRLVNPSEARWQRVRIEFEFNSRNFLEHGHDPEGCDLIVCWLHDWPECPLEVIELRKVVARMRPGLPACALVSSPNAAQPPEPVGSAPRLPSG